MSSDKIEHFKEAIQHLRELHARMQKAVSDNFSARATSRAEGVNLSIAALVDAVEAMEEEGLGYRVWASPFELEPKRWIPISDRFDTERQAQDWGAMLQGHHWRVLGE